jgi:ABC-type amino acid transport substrate-binding protein
MTMWVAKERSKGRSMWRAAAACAIVLCAAAARAQPVDPCAVPGYLLFGDSKLERAAAAVMKDKALRIAVLGGASSTLPGQDGATFAYPARLEAALSRRLPGVKVTVQAELRNRQSAEEMSDAIDKLLADDKPNLVIWQTGTYEALRGTDPEEFRAAVSDGVEKLQNGGVDVILMNMQFSPRTETVVAVGAYADAIRWVAREREVPVYDRLAIMRHWYDAGQFDLYVATKDMKTAKSVHDCIGRTLASSIIEAAHLASYEGRAPR